MEIKFDDSRLTSKNYLLEGTLDDGREFAANLNWNEFDEWNMTTEDIMMSDGAEATEQELESIVKVILDNYNGWSKYSD